MAHKTIAILNVEPDGYCDEARALLQRIGDLREAELSRDELLAQVNSYDVLIVRLAHQIDRAMLDRGARLKVIVTATTGLDHIDVDYAASRGIAVLSLRDEVEFLRSVSATAEHTWALLLALARRLPQASAHAMGGGWERDLFRGHDLDGRRLGIVGLGRIGQKVARYGLAFGMEVAAYDPYAAARVEGAEQMPSLADLLPRSQVLSLHLPLNAETIGMIGAREMALLPPGAWLVNTARGEVVDENALVDALESGHLGGAALDVIWHERDPARRASSRLLLYIRSYDKVIITPHIGGATHEAMAKTEILMARKLRAYLNAMNE